MLSYTDLKKGTLFVMDGDPYEVADSSFSRMQQRKAVVSAKIRNLRTGKIVDRSFQPSDSFEEANVAKRPLLFLYSHRGEFVFCDPKDRSRRSSLTEAIVGERAKWLKPNTEVTALYFDDDLLTFTLPIKMDFKVTEAPPGEKGDRAQSGTKTVTIETGAVIQVPLFINQDDIIRVNTELGEYTERMEKA